ncbi:hypothetical protein CBL_21154, partial [Carabus blaptoides fortunei]
KNGQTDISGKNLTELINERRTELIARIEEIMPDNANKTDRILDEAVQKIKRDEFLSSNTKTLTGGSKIYSSQWGTSTKSESSELKSIVTSSVNESTENLSYNTFTIRVTDFVTHRPGVILDEASCYKISEHILETNCPAQLDILPTMDSTNLPSSVSYIYKRDIPQSVKENSFFVIDPLRNVCYHLRKVRNVECPQDTNGLLNLRIVPYARRSQATTTETPTYMTVFPTKVERTFTLKLTEFVSHRRGVILDEIMRHMKVSCYDISEKILETDCPAQLDIVPTMDSTKFPSFVSYNYKRDIPESVKQNSFLVTNPLRKACYHLVKVRKVECPSDTNNLLNLRIVTYAGNSQSNNLNRISTNSVVYSSSEATHIIKREQEDIKVVEDINRKELELKWQLTKYVDSNNIVYCFKQNANSLNLTTCPEDTANLQFVSLTQ